jgi:hypothetical protein
MLFCCSRFWWFLLWVTVIKDWNKDCMVQPSQLNQSFCWKVFVWFGLFDSGQENASRHEPIDGFPFRRTNSSTLCNCFNVHTEYTVSSAVRLLLLMSFIILIWLEIFSLLAHGKLHSILNRCLFLQSSAVKVDLITSLFQLHFQWYYIWVPLCLVEFKFLGNQALCYDPEPLNFTCILLFLMVSIHKPPVSCFAIFDFLILADALFWTLLFSWIRSLWALPALPFLLVQGISTRFTTFFDFLTWIVFLIGLISDSTHILPFCWMGCGGGWYGRHRASPSQRLLCVLPLSSNSFIRSFLSPSSIISWTSIPQSIPCLLFLVSLSSAFSENNLLWPANARFHTKSRKSVTHSRFCSWSSVSKLLIRTFSSRAVDSTMLRSNGPPLDQVTSFYPSGVRQSCKGWFFCHSFANQDSQL